MTIIFHVYKNNLRWHKSILNINNTALILHLGNPPALQIISLILETGFPVRTCFHSIVFALIIYIEEYSFI